MFGMFQRRDPGSEAQSGDYLVSFLGMNRGGKGLSAREQLAVVHRFDNMPALNNPLSALDVSPQVSDGAPVTPPPSLATPSFAAPAVLLPVSRPVIPPTTDQSTHAPGGLTW